MSYQPYYISDYEQNSGLENYYESFLLPEKAFPLLEDAYCWKGRVKRRTGFYLLGRLRRQFVNGQNAYYPLPNTAALTVYAIADIFSQPPGAIRATEPHAEIDPETVIITIDRGGANQTTYTDNVLGVLIMTAGGHFPITLGNVNYITGSISLIFAAPLPAGLTVDISVFYFPALPVVGMETMEVPEIYQEKLVPFDQKYAYQYDYTLHKFTELDNSYPTTWSGDSSQLFWTTAYYYNAATLESIFWATNFNQGNGTGDPIRYYTPTVGWTAFAPDLDLVPAPNTTKLQQALCIIPFKSRLLMFNTWEGPTLALSVNIANRVRWSWLGDPTNQAAGWQTGPGAGGFLDATTNERIISVEPLKDVILVKFERSSWKLIYTGNQTQPFIFQRINFTFGAQSTHSLVPFDDGVFAIARNAITSDDTTSVERIDVKIPNQVFQMVNLSDANIPTPPAPGNRIYGIRDYINELVYWSFQDSTLYAISSSSVFPNKLLVLNYRNNTYAKFNDSFTVFGYFQSLEILGLQDQIQQNIPYIAAGNQQGFVELLNTQRLNSPSLAITDIDVGVLPGNRIRLTVPNHNFSATGTYIIRIDGIVGRGVNNPSIINYVQTQLFYKVTSLGANTLSLNEYNVVTGQFDIPLAAASIGPYYGSGTITVMQNYDIKTKVFCPQYQGGSKQRLPYVDFLFDWTKNGETTCLVYQNEALNALDDTQTNNPQGLLGTNQLVTYPENPDLIPEQKTQAKIWHRFYIQSICQNFQIELKMSNAQMAAVDHLDPLPPYNNIAPINDNDFVLHAMTLYLSPTARLVQ